MRRTADLLEPAVLLGLVLRSRRNFARRCRRQPGVHARPADGRSVNGAGPGAGGGYSIPGPDVA
jgi:hypothetical protein